MALNIFIFPSYFSKDNTAAPLFLNILLAYSISNKAHIPPPLTFLMIFRNSLTLYPREFVKFFISSFPFCIAISFFSGCPRMYIQESVKTLTNLNGWNVLIIPLSVLVCAKQIAYVSVCYS